ncbi:EthD domain-containing protein [Neoroseomonas lacus]|uniref:EthD domain-containing protein n=1 Tax=Neoroseomonas lacus TaxID=287609 RepID=UPI00227D4C63|nr:EthD family reductase [Neoroseomonas lacus]
MGWLGGATPHQPSPRPGYAPRRRRLYTTLHSRRDTPPQEDAIIKLVSFLARRPGMTAEAFLTHWQDVHAPMACDLPGLRGHILNIPIETHSRSDVAQLDVAPFDGIEQLWFDDQAACAAAMASPAGARWRAEAARFIGAQRGFATEEAWQVPLPAGPRPAVKSFTAIRRRDGATPEQFQYAWRVVHGGMAASVPLLRGFVLSGILAEQPRDDIPPLRMALPLDGIAESWCDDMQARRAMVVSPEAQHWFADGATFLGQVKTVLLREAVMIPPAAAIKS